MQPSESNNTASPGLPDLEALRLAALQTRKSRKGKKKENSPPSTPIATVASPPRETNSPQPTTTTSPPNNVSAAEAVIASNEDQEMSEREEGELSESESMEEDRPDATPNSHHYVTVLDEGFVTKNWGNLNGGETQNDVSARNLISEIYALGAQPNDLIEHGIPVDIVVRFSRELNHPLPPHLEIFNVLPRSEHLPQNSLSSQYNPMAPKFSQKDPQMKLQFSQFSSMTSSSPSVNSRMHPIYSQMPSQLPDKIPTSINTALPGPQSDFKDRRAMLSPTDQFVPKSPATEKSVNLTYGFPVYSSFSRSTRASETYSNSIHHNPKSASRSSTSDSSSNGGVNTMKPNHAGSSVTFKRTNGLNFASQAVVATETSSLAANRTPAQEDRYQVRSNAPKAPRLPQGNVDSGSVNKISDGVKELSISATAKDQSKATRPNSLNIPEARSGAVQGSQALKKDSRPPSTPLHPISQEVRKPVQGSSHIKKGPDNSGRSTPMVLDTQYSSAGVTGNKWQLDSYKKQFVPTRQTNYIIELSDESDHERSTKNQPGLRQNNVKLQKKDASAPQLGKKGGTDVEKVIDPKRELEAKEREIKRMNELIARTESLKKKARLPADKDAVSNTTPNSIATNATIAASVEKRPIKPVEPVKLTFEMALERASTSCDPELLNLVSEIKAYPERYAELNNTIIEGSKELEEIRKKITSTGNEMGESLNQINVTQSKIKDTQSKINDLQQQFIEYQANLKTTEQKRDEVSKKQNELSEKADNLTTSFSQLRAKLDSMTMEHNKRKEELLGILNKKQEIHAKDDPQSSIENTTEDLNENGKRNATTLSETIGITESSLQKKAKINAMVEIEKRIENVRKEQKDLWNNMALLSKRKVQAQLGDNSGLTYNQKSNSSSNSNNQSQESRATIKSKLIKSAVTKNLEPKNLQIDYPRFTPYISPLRYFRSFRFHPHYLEIVKPEGYKCLTYSHKVDHKKKLCLFETQPRGICNDDTCESQHFRDLAMTDDEVLNDLASYVEGTDSSLRQTYRDEVAKLMSNAKAQGITDLNVLVGFLIRYRNDFTRRIEQYHPETPRIICMTPNSDVEDAEATSPSVEATSPSPPSSEDFSVPEESTDLPEEGEDMFPKDQYDIEQEEMYEQDEEYSQEEGNEQEEFEQERYQEEVEEFGTEQQQEEYMHEDEPGYRYGSKDGDHYMLEPENSMPKEENLEDESNNNSMTTTDNANVEGQEEASFSFSRALYNWVRGIN